MSSKSAGSVTDLEVQRRKRSNEVVFAKLIDTTVDWMRDSGSGPVSVGGVAARAGVSRSTAEELFSCTDELVLETCLLRIRNVALTVEESHGSVARAARQLGQMMLVVAEEPAIASACAAAFLNNEAAAARARENIGLEIHRLIVSAMGPGCWPEVVTTLEFMFSGALIQAAMGTMSFQQAADGVETAVSLIVAGRLSVDE